MKIFKISYTWYEGEFGETYLGKNIDKIQFEKDIKEAKDFAKNLIGKEIKEGDFLGKGYYTECLPEFYHQIIWFLVNKKDYVECFLDDSDYSIDDDSYKKILVEKIDKKIKKTIL